MRFVRFLLLFNCVISVMCGTVRADDSVSTEDRVFFETKIRPVLVKHCFQCHASDAKEIGGNLMLDQPSALLLGGESGHAIVAGEPDKSLLIQALRYEDLEMPPGGPLPEQVVNDFVRWVSRGAPDPRPKEPAKTPSTDLTRLDPDQLWSFYPRSNVLTPKVGDPTWPRDPIDQFVLSQIEAHELTVSKDAVPDVLIRRLYYDLIGLPPSLQEITQFASDYAKDARRSLVRTVDALLQRPEFGERWGRHWLDVARFGESNGDDGLGRNATFPHAWRYRDYVISSINSDMPYDEFLTEQIAGDLLPSTGAQERNRRLTATGFLAIGPKPAAAMNKNFAMDIVDDQINVVSTAVMGLSVACARCHDHKHDPIPTRDYYALAGIFSSTETLYGLAGNEKLTAPPTPLHELKPDWNPKPPPKQKALTGDAPSLPDDYWIATSELKPFLQATLEQKVDTLKFSKDVKLTSKNWATFKNSIVSGTLPEQTTDYSVAFWFKNELNNDARPITAYLFSRAKLDDKALPGDHIGIGGQHDKQRTGKIFVFNGNKSKVSLAGDTVIPKGTWNHLILIRQRDSVRVYLNGRLEIDGPLPATFGSSTQFNLATRSDRFAPLQGNIGQLSIYDRELTANEALILFDASGRSRAETPATHSLAMGVRDQSTPVDCKVHIDGDGAKKGPSVPRGFPSIYRKVNTMIEEQAIETIDKKSSGRLQLAKWLTSPQHPQTSRVIANRVWMHLFGKPIVATPDDFGVYGARPTHPDLLDHLSQRLIDNDWSIKQLVRAIVLSRTYQLSGRATESSVDSDPDNIWLSRHSIRRLDAESLRDSVLAACGSLDGSPRQGSPIQKTEQLINWPPGEATNLHQPCNHRSIYLCMLRHDPPQDLVAFDLPDGVSIAGRRNETTLPTQALFLLNSDFLVQQSEHLASGLIPSNESSEIENVRRAFHAILRRDPTEHEISQSLQHVHTVHASLADLSDRSDQRRLKQRRSQQRQLKSWASLCQGLLSSNEFRYID
ncbi:MAG: DUF1553 domain-containing protein [Pirellulaceae bacterium]